MEITILADLPAVYSLLNKTKEPDVYHPVPFRLKVL